MSVQPVEPAMRTPAAAFSAVPTSPEPPLSEPAILALESQIMELWGHINAATYRFLVLVAKLDRTQSWWYYGCASCVQWLNLKCGRSARGSTRVRIAMDCTDGKRSTVSRASMNWRVQRRGVPPGAARLAYT